MIPLIKPFRSLAPWLFPYRLVSVRCTPHVMPGTAVLGVNEGRFRDAWDVYRHITGARRHNSGLILYWRAERERVRYFYDSLGTLIFTDDSATQQPRPFYGTDARLNRYAAGDAVLFIVGGVVEAGTITAMPPDPRRVRKINAGNDAAPEQQRRELVAARGGSLLDCTDNAYLIDCADGDHAHVFEHDIVCLIGNQHKVAPERIACVHGTP